MGQPPYALRTDLIAKLDELAEPPADGAGGIWLLATFELSGFDAFEREHGSTVAGELRERLGTRLAAAVGRAGDAYRIAHARFALLAQIGRGGPDAILSAATAALTDVEPGVRIVAVPASVQLAPGAPTPRAALHRLEADLRMQLLPQPELAAAAVAPTRAASAALQPAPELPPLDTEDRADQATEPALATPGDDADRTADPAPTAPHEPDRTPGRLPYLRVVTRFRISVLLGLLWMSLSTWLAWPWIQQLAATLTLPGAILLVAGIALIPGYLNVQLVASLAMDRPRALKLNATCPGLTLLIAAFNEEQTIAQTVAYALGQDYPGDLHVMVLDDGSTDETASIAHSFAATDDRLTVLTVPHGGKAEALNAGLAVARTPLVATIDADTLLMPEALLRIVARLQASPPHTAAVAGSVLVRNSRGGLLAAAQSWDYFLGIGSIKRQQALLQATLVAQGAFSVYVAQALRDVGGWPDCIGEDIVMTWALLNNGAVTSFEPTAVAFTEAPTSVSHLARQRRRWARGMIEGLRTYGVALLRRHAPYAHSVAANVIFPYLDVAFTFAFLPGIVLALTGNFAIVGPMTLAVLPLNLLLAAIMYRRQRTSLHEAGLHVRRHLIGFLGYVFLYQVLMSPVSVAGYTQELLHAGRRW